MKLPALNVKSDHAAPALLVGACQFCGEPMQALAHGWECTADPSHRLVWAQMLPIADPRQAAVAQKALIAMPYFGGKPEYAFTIASLYPEHDHYIEVCGGGASVLLNKAPSRIETYNDLDIEVVTFFRVLRDHTQALLRLLQLTPWSRTEFELARGPIVGLSDLEIARRFYVRIRQGFNALPRRRANGWKYRIVADTATCPATWLNSLSALEAVAQRLQQVQIECREGFPKRLSPPIDSDLSLADMRGVYDEKLASKTIVRKYGQSPRNLLYVDPPYLLSLRSSTSSPAQNMAYEHEMTDEDHEDLADALNVCKAKVILSGYRGSLYDELYKDWLRIDLPERMIHSSKAIRQESLWLNYDPPVQALLKLKPTKPEARQLAMELEGLA